MSTNVKVPRLELTIPKELGSIGVVQVFNSNGGSKDMSIDSFIAVMRKHQQMYLLSKYSKKIIYGGRVMIIEYYAGSYCVVEGDRINEVVWMPFISKELITGNRDILKKGHIRQYIKLYYGERAPRGFWSMMNEDQYEDILEFESLYVRDIHSKEIAIHLATKDIIDIRIPAPVRSERFTTLYIIAAKGNVGHLAPWEMKHLPKGYVADENSAGKVIRMVGDYLLQINNLRDIDHITRKHLLLVAPSVYAVAGSIKKFREIYRSELEKR